MTWLKYFKENETVSSTVINENYSYPICKRFLDSFIPRDTLPKDSWLFASIDGLNINTYQNSSILIEEDDSSYIVVYEFSDSFTPVKTVINDNYLYFQTAEQHNAKEKILGRYAVYYNSKNLRKIHEVDNAGQVDYQVSSSDNPYYAQYSEVYNNTFEVDLNSDLSYNFSFINSFEDWDNGKSKKVGAKVYISFSGPSIIIKGSRGPENGKLRLKVIGLSGKNYPTSNVQVDWVVIDTYSSKFEDNYIIYQNDNLEERDYILEIEVINEKNQSSSGNLISISSYLFKYNLYLKLGKELINQIDNSFTLLGGIR